MAQRIKILQSRDGLNKRVRTRYGYLHAVPTRKILYGIQCNYIIHCTVIRNLHSEYCCNNACDEAATQHYNIYYAMSKGDKTS